MTRERAVELIDELVEACIDTERRSGQQDYWKDFLEKREKVIAIMCGDYEPPDPKGWEGGFAKNH